MATVIMNREETLQLLNRFVDHNRSNMNQPFAQDLKIGRYLCATNAKVVIIVPETEENKIDNSKGYNPPNIDRIVPDFSGEIEFDFSTIIKLYNEVPVIERFVMEECDSCDGHGEFEHHGDTYACKKCNEKGELQTTFREKVKSPYTAFRFHSNNIDIQYISTLIVAYNTIKPETFYIMNNAGFVTWFRMDNSYIGIAGIGVLEDGKNEFKIVNVELNTIITK